MRVLPNIAGTVINTPLQSDLKDISGNGLDWASVDCVTNAPVAAPPFTNIQDKSLGIVTSDACLMGVNLNAGAATTKLMAPLSPLLQITGPCTFEWVMTQKFTFTVTYVAVADPAGRSGGVGPDRIGSLLTLWSDSGNPEYSDQHISGGPGFPGYNDHVLFNWSGAGAPAVGDWHSYLYGYTFDGTTHRTYRNGITVGAGLATAGANVATGTERMFLGAIEKQFLGTGATGIFSSFRGLNFCQSGAAMLADANAVLGPCATQMSYRGLRIRLDNHQ